MATDGFTTCLWYDGQAEEAANFYVSVFKNSGIGKVAHYPEGAMQPAGSVMTVEFTANGHKFLALNGGPQFKFTEATSFMIFCENQEEIDYYWEKLTEGGGEPGPAGGSRTGSGCPGRSSRTASTPWSPTRTRRRRPA